MLSEEVVLRHRGFKEGLIHEISLFLLLTHQKFKLVLYTRQWADIALSRAVMEIIKPAQF